MTDLRTSQIDATIFDHDPARGDQIAPHSARADAILGRVLAAPEPTTLVASELHVRRGWHVIVQQRRSLAAAVAIVLALAAAGAGALTLGPAGRLTPPGHHVAVRTTMPHETVQAGPQKWVLVGYVGNAWRTLPTPVNEKGFSLTCPTDEACYALGGVQDPSGGSRLVVEVTMDGGATWTEAAALPSGLVSTSRLSCSDARNCALLGLDGAGVGSLIETSDAGQTWSVNRGPTGTSAYSEIGGLSCSSTADCVTVLGDPVSGSQAAAFRTTDGGQVWSQSSLPAGMMPDSLSCDTAGDCVAAGLGATQTGNSVPIAEAAYSSGSGWTESKLPPGAGSIGALSCFGSSDCLASASSPDGSPDTVLLLSTDGGETFAAVSASGLPSAVVSEIACAGPSTCTVGGATPSTGSQPETIANSPGLIASTVDAGQTFQTAQLPEGIGAVISVSCPSATSCYAVAFRGASTGFGSFVLLSDKG